MHVVFDADDDAKWITIHPNGSSKGRHVKVNGEGEIVAGNKHLVAALSGEGGADKHTDKNVKGVASAPLSDAVGETFTPLEEDGFDGIFDEFKSPQEEDFTSLLEDDVGVEQKSDDGVDDELARGAVTLEGKRLRVGIDCSTQPFKDYVNHKLAGTGKAAPANSSIDAALRGVKPALVNLAALLGDGDPLVRAIRDRMEYVEERVKRCRNIANDAKHITQDEAYAVCKAHFDDVGTLYSHGVWGHPDLEGSKAEQEKKVRYIAAAVEDFKTRFPKAQLLKVMKHTTFAIDNIEQHHPLVHIMGLCKVTVPVVQVDTCAYDIQKKQHHKSQSPLAVSPCHSAAQVPASSTSYWPEGSEVEGVLLHELAHRYAIMYDADLTKFKTIIGGGSEYYGELHYKKIAPYISHYAETNIEEFHSELVATVASPMYIQGSLPEVVEKYVYENVLGREPGTWKKREQMVNV